MKDCSGYFLPLVAVTHKLSWFQLHILITLRYSHHQQGSLKSTETNSCSLRSKPSCSQRVEINLWTDQWQCPKQNKKANKEPTSCKNDCCLKSGKESANLNYYLNHKDNSSWANLFCFIKCLLLGTFSASCSESQLLEFVPLPWE